MRHEQTLRLEEYVDELLQGGINQLPTRRAWLSTSDPASHLARSFWGQLAAFSRLGFDISVLFDGTVAPRDMRNAKRQFGLILGTEAAETMIRTLPRKSGYQVKEFMVVGDGVSLFAGSKSDDDVKLLVSGYNRDHVFADFAFRLPWALAGELTKQSSARDWRQRHLDIPSYTSSHF